MAARLWPTTWNTSTPTHTGPGSTALFLSAASIGSRIADGRLFSLAPYRHPVTATRSRVYRAIERAAIKS
jgi:hypothetical protein